MEFINNIINFFTNLFNVITTFIIIFLLVLYIRDYFQKQHAIRRTHPVLGRLRDLFEHLGKPFRQYFFLNDTENKPIDRNTQDTIAKAGKYASTIMGFGSVRDHDKPGFYLNNSLFPRNNDELLVDNINKIKTFRYKLIKEGEFFRKETRISDSILPWYLKEPIIIGENTPNPWIVKGFIGVSAMSYGALSDVAVMALTQGVAISGGSWINTGEGGISPYHLSKIYEINEFVQNPIFNNRMEKKIYDFIKDNQVVSNFEINKHFNLDVHNEIRNLVQNNIIIEKSADLIFQIGSGLFGARVKGTKEPIFSEEEFIKNASRKEVKAIEIKLAQGAKTKGGHVEGSKVTPEIAEIRGVEPYKTIESPNRFKQFNDIDSLFEFIKKLKDLSKKPVGIKVVIGSNESFEDIAKAIKEKNFGPDFITIDGGEGGTGATYQEMADSVGLPIYSAIMIVDDTLKKYGVRDKVKIFASGLLATADKMAIALSLGADLINVARPAMNTIGCINAMKCHTNECPTGVTSHDPKLKRGLVVEEKRFRTANYLATMRYGVFMLSAACGVESPTLLNRKHVSYKYADSKTIRADNIHSL